MNTEFLAQHYRRFNVSERILLTGHSHQAWPDVAFEGLEQAFVDAALHVDDKWSAAADVAASVRSGFAKLLGEPNPDALALGQNTHELVTRFLSALPLHKRPRLVTTDGEFHTIRRQLDRLAEAGVEVLKVAARPVAKACVVEIPPSQRGGFLALRLPNAQDVSQRLRERHVWTDARGPFLRLGPAPYVTDAQLEDAVQALVELVR